MVSQISYKILNLVSTDGSVSITTLPNGNTNLEAAGGGGTPSAPNTSVQFNNAGAFGGSANFTYTVGTNRLSVPNLTLTSGSLISSAPFTLNVTGGDATYACAGNLTFYSTGAVGRDIGFTAGSGVNGGNIQLIGGLGGAGPGGAFQLFGGDSTSDVGGDCLFFPGSGPVANGSLVLSDGQIYLIQCQYDTPTDQSRMGFFNATPVAKPAPTASGTGSVLSSVVTALNSLGLVDSASLTNSAQLFSGLLYEIPFSDGSGGFSSVSKFNYVGATNTLTIGAAGNNVNSTLTAVAPTGSTVAGILRLLGTNASATNGVGGGITLTTGNGTGTQRGGNFILTSGTGGFTGASYTGVGGNITLTSGIGRIGGNFTMTSGFGSVTNGGSFTMSGGQGTTNGGSFTLTGGSGADNGGAINITSGTTFSGASGDISISAGAGGSTNGQLDLQQGAIRAKWSGGGDDPTLNQIGFYQTTPVDKQTVSGSRATGAALESLLLALSNMGLITDSTSA